MEASSPPHPASHIPHRSRTVLVLVGPTASGKTPVSLLIAHRLRAEIISADSRQIYKFMDIGTAKPSPEERFSVKHHFVDELLPDEDFNAAEFGKSGRIVINDLLQKGSTPLVVGGSGLYVEALIDGFFEGPPADSSIREELERRVSEVGGGVLLEELRLFDPEAASKMLPSHTRRIIRAHEVFRLTGIPISKLQSTRIPIDFRSLIVGLRWPRVEIYRRIEERIDRMLGQGLIDEAKRLREAGYSSKNNALNTVAYKETFDFLDGRISYGRAVELMKQNSRRYAKRQLTWFRNDSRIRWFDIHGEEEFPSLAEQICEFYEHETKSI